MIVNHHTEQKFSQQYSIFLHFLTNQFLLKNVIKGFDETGSIFLGESAHKFQQGDDYDGFTTNGLFIFQPSSQQWFAVSTSLGTLFRMQYHGNSLLTTKTEFSNTLEEGTIISTGTLGFIWKYSMVDQFSWDASTYFSKINNAHYVCPVMLTTIYFPSTPTLFPACGHIFSANEHILKESKCPLCRTNSAPKPLAIAPYALLLDEPTHCFNPCGCATSWNQAQFCMETKWISTMRKIERYGRCPRCMAVRISFIIIFLCP